MKTPVDIRSFIQKVVEENRFHAEQQGVVLTLEMEEDVPQRLLTDQVKLSQALNALIQQALIRTQGGAVIVRVRKQEEQVTISVEDTGWQPAAEVVRAVLDPKSSAGLRGQDERMAQIAMPLRLSAKFIGLLGGRLEMTNSKEGATCFSFVISDSASPSSSSSCSVQEQSSAEQKKDAGAPVDIARVLIVDDVQENRALLEVLLKKMGCVCAQCANGKEAVDLCRRQKFDLILIDLQMPIMDGFEAIRQIRSDSMNQKTPILAMTASGQKGDDLKALDAGCSDCLGKPISREKLQRKVWRLLAQQKQLKAAETGGEILSFLEGDPDYQKAVETFVENLPAKIEEMRKAFEKRDWKDLAFKAHALKGLGGFAGFPVFTEKAKCLEETVKAEDVERIAQQLDEMVQLCMRTRLQNK
jgi:CheY-like chemotaxis protein/HPt (histidine-containing phosphotransfer) domain-containing protein